MDATGDKGNCSVNDSSGTNLTIRLGDAMINRPHICGFSALLTFSIAYGWCPSCTAEPATRRAAADRGFSQTRLLVLTQRRVPWPGTYADPALAANARGHAVRNRRDRLRGFHLRPGPRLLPQGQRAVCGRGYGPIGSEGNRITLNENERGTYASAGTGAIPVYKR
jgi:hypothetical protein